MQRFNKKNLDIDCNDVQFTENFKNVYNDVKKKFPSKKFFTNNNTPNYFRDIESEYIDHIEIPNKKKGIKSLLNNNSNFIYPFAKEISSDIKVPEVTENTINEEIKLISEIKNMFIPTIVHNKSYLQDYLDTEIMEKPYMPRIVHSELYTEKENIKNVVDEINMDNASNEIKEICTQKNMYDDNIKIDIKNDIIIDNYRSIMTSPLEKNIEQISNENMLKFPELNVLDTQDLLNDKQKNVYNGIELSIENVNTTFKVIGDLREGVKVKIVDDLYLAEENSYITSFTRYTNGQSRDNLMNFLNHLFEETKRNTMELLTSIRANHDIDNKISELENIYSNLNIFIHRFDIMRNVYKGDTGTYAKLGVIHNKFLTYRQSFFRDMVIHKKN